MNLPFVTNTIPRTRENDIIREVARRHGLNYHDLFSDWQTPAYVFARFEAFHRIQMEMGWSLTRIGRLFGMDHTSIRHGIMRHRGIPLAMRRGPKHYCMVTAMGRTMNASQWSRVTGVHEGTIRLRIRRGWDGERAVLPVHIQLATNT